MATRPIPLAEPLFKDLSGNHVFTHLEKRREIDLVGVGQAGVALTFPAGIVLAGIGWAAGDEMAVDVEPVMAVCTHPSGESFWNGFKPELFAKLGGHEILTAGIDPDPIRGPLGGRDKREGRVLRMDSRLDERRMDAWRVDRTARIKGRRKRGGGGD